MAQFQLRMWPTRAGEIAAYADPAPASATRPVVVVLHGALRRSEALFPWAERLADLADPVLMDLPGHGASSPCDPASIRGMADAVHEAICAALPGRHVLLVGESLGGTVALDLGSRPGPVCGVFAADPPMTTGKLWNLAGVFRSAMGKSAAPAFVDRLGRDTFGITPTGIEERIYYPLVGALRAPAVIATGDIPLLPPRALSGVACLFDEVDRFVVETHYGDKARVERIAGCGHVLLVEAAQACLDIVAGMLAAAPFAEPRL